MTMGKIFKEPPGFDAQSDQGNHIGIYRIGQVEPVKQMGQNASI
jgi:hypothetical protein